MTFYSLIDRYVLLPIAARLQKSRILKEFVALEQSDWLSESELLALQNEKLQKLVHHCYNNVPYYTKLFDRLHISPDDIKCREDLSKLPILTKQIIRENYDEIISTDIHKKNVRVQSSGGSTGVPLKYMTDKAIWGNKWSSTFRAWNWYGFHVGEKIFTLGGNSLVKTKQERSRITAKDIFDRCIMRNLKCDCTDLSEAALHAVYTKMMAYKPSVLRGYPAAIYNLSKFILERNLKAPNIHMVLTTGEMLLPIHRLTIQKAFHVPLYDAYGAGDGGIISHECYMHEGLHITEEQCVVEIVDKNGMPCIDGVVGFVLTTDLENYAFPFIRYQVGDMASIKQDKCSCGRASRLIGQVVGRTGKTLYNKHGQPFTSVIIDNMMFKNMDYHRSEHEDLYRLMEQFQVRQDKNGDITILIKPKDKLTSISTFSYVKDNFKKYFEDSNIDILFVDEIPKMPSGKEDYCVSDYKWNNKKAKNDKDK